ncbi:hypothetical protein [Wocania ichthyoenteri]|uniref:hypothetical protein n=1 Tax=Wocania ichthyoenteri TaxID=1230531 RepID=UPI00053ECB48|nr:hypothetical protein [Wocania ichthyoenteri]
MSSTATKSKNFKQMFLYRDSSWIEQQKKFNLEKIPFLNECLVEVQKIFDRELTISEKTEILQFGWKKVQEMHRSKSQFPKANIKTLLELHGISGEMVDNAEKVLNENSSRFRDDIFAVTSTGVQLNIKYLKDIEEKGNYYTTSEAQNQKLQTVTNIAKELNTAIDLKIIHKWQIQDIIKTTNKLLGYGITPLNNEGFNPNYETIRKL